MWIQIERKGQCHARHLSSGCKFEILDNNTNTNTSKNHKTNTNTNTNRRTNYNVREACIYQNRWISRKISERGGHFRSENFSGNSSVLVYTGFPKYNLSSGCKFEILDNNTNTRKIKKQKIETHIQIEAQIKM